MKKNSINKLILLFLATLALSGCRKNFTNYFADAADEGLAIFSNTGNNLMTCFVDGKPWRTINRTQTGNGFPVYEVAITKQTTAGVQDTLVIHWTGHYNGEEISTGAISLSIAVPKNFNYRNFSSLQGQRLFIDTAVNGFFSTGISALSIGDPKGNGSIYFNTARLDSIAPGKYTGYMSGILEANFPSFKITRGRFDGWLNEENVEL